MGFFVLKVFGIHRSLMKLFKRAVFRKKGIASMFVVVVFFLKLYSVDYLSKLLHYSLQNKVFVVFREF